MALEELSFESVNGQTDGWTDAGRTENGQKVITKAHPEHSSGELKIAKSFQSEFQDGRHSSHLENLFFASSPEPKCKLTQNLVHVGSIGVTCRSKIAKIVPIRNP